VQRYFDETERVTNLGYQIGINAEETTELTSVENVKHIAKLLDGYLKGERYRCLQRKGQLTIMPLTVDENVTTGYVRYICCLENKTNTIYRRI
jgi:hypothetical protein